MRIGLFTDTYYPQVSGVATSIRTLKTELEKQGHAVFIFTTTDKDVNRYEDWQIIRIPSVPFFAFKLPSSINSISFIPRQNFRLVC